MAMTNAREVMIVTIIPGMTSIRKRGLAAALILAALGIWVAAPTLSALAFVLDLAGIDSVWRQLIPIRPRPFATDEITVGTRHGPVPLRVYRPQRPTTRTAVVFPGVHGGGVDEARLTRFCGRLAASGMIVVCAPLPELRQRRANNDHAAC